MKIYINIHINICLNIGHSVVSSSSAHPDATSEELIQNYVEESVKIDKIKKLKRKKNKEDDDDVKEDIGDDTQIEDRKIKKKKRDEKEVEEVGETYIYKCIYINI
jgi:hypothetical protein